MKTRKAGAIFEWVQITASSTVCCGPRRPLGFQHLPGSPRRVVWGSNFSRKKILEILWAHIGTKKVFGGCVTICVRSKKPKHLRYFISYLERSCWRDRMRVGGGISMIKNLSAPSLSWPDSFESRFESAVCAARGGDSSDLAVNKILPVPLSVSGGWFCGVLEGAALTSCERSLSQQHSGRADSNLHKPLSFSKRLPVIAVLQYSNWLHGAP